MTAGPAVDETADAGSSPAVPPPPGHGRAGRNLPAAIAVGLGLGTVILLTLFLVKPAFVGVVAATIAVGTWELCRALRVKGLRPPYVPVIAGGIVVLALGYARGPDGMTVAALLAAAAVVVWRLGDGADGYLGDVAAGLLAIAWVPFLAGFAVLLTAPDDGDRRVVAFIVTVVCSDVGGYAVGVLAGRHPLAPRISPKKSWEGLAGSTVACAIGGGILLPTLLDAAIWQGVVFGLVTVATATLGDLGESLVKRDIGIKDMGRLLPGHGGVMDRIDSLLMTAPFAWLLLSAFVPTP